MSNKNKKIAICLYGQPRNYKYGYNCINNLIKENSEYIYDFFFHCWIDHKYKCSPWRKIDTKDLIIENINEIKNELKKIYKPVSYLYEKSIDEANKELLIDIENIKKSISYKNSKKKIKTNLYNTLSQMYSRNKVKDLFEQYIISTKKKYDMVISTRFDGFCFPKKLKIPEVKKTKIYVSSMHRPRYIIPDNFLIIPPEIYINWFNLYKNIKNIINNNKILMKMHNINESMIFNMEEIVLSNYFFCGYDINNIEFAF